MKAWLGAVAGRAWEEIRFSYRQPSLFCQPRFSGDAFQTPSLLSDRWPHGRKSRIKLRAQK
jgi:hypothetical protein